MNILINEIKKVTFVMVDTAGTEVAGLGTGITVQISKNGGAFGASAGTKAEIGSGWYSYTFTTAETDTLGPLAVKITGAGAVQQNILYEVVGSDWSSVPTYATSAELKTYLGITGSGDDDLLTNLLARSQKAIEVYCGRVFDCDADTTHYFAVGEDTDGNNLWFDGDLCQITTVTTDADGTPISLTANVDYVTQPRNSTPYYGLKLLESSANYWDYTSDPEMGISITGRWAYSITPPQDIIHANIRLAAYYYRQKDAQVFDVTAIPDAGILTVPQGMPKDVKQILDSYRKPAL
jgi:hypothetical protein